MEKTYCIFNTSPEGLCAGPRHSHINYLICAHHLKQFYGLEVASFFVEKRTQTCYGGWILRPSPGTHFKKNDIIIPMRAILDVMYRTNKKGTIPNEELEKYTMNPILDKHMHAAVHSGNRLSVGDRRAFEMIRNLSEPLELINLNPIDLCETDASAVAYIKSKMTMSQTYIEEYSGYPLENYTVYAKDKDENLANMKNVSHHFRYFLAKAEYSSHIAEDKTNSAREIHRMNYNAMYIPHIGLVASRDITNPNTIVVLGTSRGKIENDDGFYKTHVICVDKEIIQPRVAPHMVAQQNALKKAFVTGFH